MPRPARPWFRFYTEALADRKLRRLKPAQRWLWVAVMAAARESPRPGVLLDGAADTPMTAAALADYAGMTERDVRATMPEFERSGMVHRDGAAWVVTNFGRRQFESDDVTARTRKHRSKEPPPDDGGNVPTPSPGTPNGTGHGGSRERSSSRGHATSARHALATESETETEIPTSSDTSPRVPDPPDDDPGHQPPSDAPPGHTSDPRVGAALGALAQRDLDDLPPDRRVGDPVRWLRTGYDRRLASHGHALEQLAIEHPDATPARLADLADPPPDATPSDPLAGQRAAAMARAEAGQAHAHAIAEQQPDTALNVAAVRALRAQHHLGTRPTPGAA